MADKKPATKKATKTSSDLSSKSLEELRVELRDARMSHRAGELVNPRRLRELRREIARKLTAINAEKGVE